jgi:hypothetical protein
LHIAKETAVVGEDSGHGRRSAGRVREESLLDEMRAAVRGDRQRAEQRRAQEPDSVDDAPPEAESPEAEPESAELRPEERGFLKRLTRRSVT